jgi:hypothetical protein
MADDDILGANLSVPMGAPVLYRDLSSFLLADDTGATCFIDDNGITSFYDDLGRVLTC